MNQNKHADIGIGYRDYKLCMYICAIGRSVGGLSIYIGG